MAIGELDDIDDADRAEGVDRAGGAGVALPPIYCPIDPAIHPRTREVEREAEAWIRRSGFWETEAEYGWITASHSVDFYARFVPSATDERLLATALWVYWGFAFDDACCDSGPLTDRPDRFAVLAGRVQRAVDAPSCRDTAERFVPPLQQIVGRFRVLGSDLQVRRFAAAHRAWLSGVAWQIGNRAQGIMPELDEYLAMRRLSAGGEPTYAMLELGTGQEVPAGELESRAVRALTEMAMLVAALDNDRHSLAKEATRQHTDQNIYTVLMHHEKRPLSEVVIRAAALRDLIIRRYLELAERVERKASQELRSYLGGLALGMRGNAEWGLRVPRYLSLGEDPDGMDHTTRLEWADRPLAESLAPPLPPTIAWWWDKDLA